MGQARMQRRTRVLPMFAALPHKLIQPQKLRSFEADESWWQWRAEVQ